MAEDDAFQERIARCREDVARNPDVEIPATEAREILGISDATLARLLRGDTPTLPWRPDVLDRRFKFVKLQDVLALYDQRPPKRPKPE